jgi:hypothetical protein
MTHAPQAPDDVDHYEAALQASCATLMTLHAIRVRVASVRGEIADVDLQISDAIEALQVAIRELRLSHAERYGRWSLQAVVRDDAYGGEA